jgi:hypothetical protein
MGSDHRRITRHRVLVIRGQTREDGV